MPRVNEFFGFDVIQQQTLENLFNSFLEQAVARASLTTPGTVLQGATVAAATVPFADLTAAANAYNALRTSLRNAGIVA